MSTGTLIAQGIEPCTMAKVGHCLDLELHKLVPGDESDDLP